MFITFHLLRRCGAFENTSAPEVIEKKLNAEAKAIVAIILTDALLFITCLVIGILGLKGIIQNLPPAANYALIGFSGIVFLPWITVGILSKGRLFKESKDLLQAAIL